MNQLGILCFTSVARTQSFSATARELRISQQAVSKHIRTLEDELGFPLFLRSYQTVQLTKAGEQMLNYFDQRDRLLNGIQEHFRSVLSCIHMIPCTIVCDARFGYLRKEDGIYNIPLNADSDLCCIWLKTNENPLIHEFIEHLKWYYSYHEQS